MTIGRASVAIYMTFSSKKDERQMRTRARIQKRAVNDRSSATAAVCSDAGLRNGTPSATP